jgi:5-methylcytosine-specific restriction enzyme subunit McrC
MISYANVTRCYEAFLIYPTPLKELLDVRIRDIRIRSLTFSLDGELDQAGQVFLQDLLVLS